MKKPIRPILYSNEGGKESFRPITYDKKEPDQSYNIGARIVKDEEYCNEKLSINTNSRILNPVLKDNNHTHKNNTIRPITTLKQSERFTINPKGDLCLICNGVVTEVCNFIAYPVEEVIVDDGYSTKKKYILAGVINGIRNLPRITITASEFQNSDWIYRKWGLECKIYAVYMAYELIKEYISDQMENVKKRYEFDHVGWRFINGRHVYLHGAGAIGSNDSSLQGKREYRLEINPNLTEEHAFKRLVDMLNIANYKISISLLTYTILGILNKPFKEAGFEPKFILFLNGITGSRKTTLAKMFSNIFNRSIDFIPSSFKDTQAALEMKAFEYRDSVLVVDDFHPTTSGTERKSMEAKASYLMRIYGDKMPKSRMNKYMQKQREFTPKGLCLITGEDTIGGSSTTARYISLEIKKNDVNLSKLTEHQQEMQSYSTSLAYFIKFISMNYNWAVSHVRNEFLHLREIHQNNFNHGRLVETFISLNIAFGLLLKYGENVGVLNCHESKQLRILAGNIFKEILKEHDDKMITQDPGIMYLSAIRELIKTGKAKIIEKNDVNQKQKNIIGYKDEEKLYLIPKTTHQEVIQFWKRLNKEFPLTYIKTNEALDNLGVLETQYEGNKRVRTIKVTIGGTRARYLILDINKIDEILLNID